MEPEVVAVVAIIFIACPAVIMHFLVKWRETKGLSTDDERMLEDLWRSAQRMEKRIESLETILDDAQPEWRDQEARERPGAGPRPRA